LFFEQSRVRGGYDAPWPTPVERDIIAEALREGQKRGVITRQEITKDRKPFAWLQRLLQEAR